MDEYDSPWLDSDEEYLKSWNDHPSRWFGPPRFVVHCPVCGRGMRSERFLEPVPGQSLPICSTCRNDFIKRNHTEQLRRPTK